MSKTVFVLPDQHYAPKDCPGGGVDQRAESVALQALEIIKPDTFINIGDVGEWNSVSPWKYKRRKRPPLRYLMDDLDKDALAVNRGLDRWDSILDSVGCADRRMIQGNHEIWIDSMVDEIPQVGDTYLPKNLMRLDDRGYKYYPYGVENGFKIGHLNFYHGGHYTTVYHARKHLQELSASVMYGHTHDQQTSKMPTLGGYHGAWSIGCICKRDKEFLKGRPTNWSHNFAIVHVEKNGTFHVEVVEIYNGRCYLWGQKLQS